MISVIRIINGSFEQDVKEVAAMTSNRSNQNVKFDNFQTYLKWLQSEHSPIRVIQISITFVNVSKRFVGQLRTHDIGTEFFVSTRRPDRCNDPEKPYDLILVCNPQSIINIARRRLCNKSHDEIRNEMWSLKKILMDHDGKDHVSQFFCALGHAMKPNCEYQKCCYEFQPCGEGKGI